MTGAPFAAPERILIVALDNLGDLVFASALTPPLREAFPDATIDVWCKSYTAPVARARAARAPRDRGGSVLGAATRTAARPDARDSSAR